MWANLNWHRGVKVKTGTETSVTAKVGSFVGQGRVESGEWKKGQQSWNSSVTNEVRDTVGILSGIAISCSWKILPKQTNILEALLLVTNQADPFKGL